MARHVFSVLCRSVAVDPFDNQLNIFEATNELSMASAVPINPGEIIIPGNSPVGVFVSLLQRSEVDVPEEVTIRVDVVAPGGQIFVGAEGTIDLKGGRSGRHLLKFAGWPYTTDGQYLIQLQRKADSGWQLLAGYPVMVSVSVTDKQGS